MSIEIRLFGQVSIRDASGCELEEVSRQPRLLALLACLAVPPAGTLVRRDTLLAWFWPERDADRARGTLRTAVYRLRSVLGGDAIVTRGSGEIGVDPASVWCDAREMDLVTADLGSRAEADVAHLTDALGWYRGPFLEGFHVTGASVELDDWIASNRAHFTRRASALAVWLAGRAECSEDWATAVEHARTAAAIDPLDDVAARTLVTVLGASGDTQGARRAYRDFEATLGRELGAAPAAATRAALASFESPAPGATGMPVATREVSESARPAGRVGAPTLRAARWRRHAAVGAIIVVVAAGLLRVVPPLMSHDGTREPGAASPTASRAPSWRPVVPAGTMPLPRDQHVAVLDATGDRALVFAGRVGTTIVADIWELSGMAGGGVPRWARRMVANGESPSPRWMQASAYDARDDRLLVFGGALGFSAPCTDEVWLLTHAFSADAAAWSRVRPRGPGPGSRGDVRAALDVEHDRLIVHGGHDCVAGAFGDVWVLSGALRPGGSPAWTRLIPDSSAGSPGPRRGHSLAFDPSSGNAILFGGLDSALRAHDDVWILTHANGLGTPPAWKHLAVSGPGPAPRGHHSAVLDPETNRLVVYGGVDSDSHVFDDAWVLIGANGETPESGWQRLAPSGNAPAARLTHTALYDRRNDRLIVYGGNRGRARLGDLWILSSATGR